MLIPATRLTPYLDLICKALGPLPSSSHSIRVQHKTGALWRNATAGEVKALADQQQIFGIGSPSKLRHAVLDVAPEEAEETLERAKQQTTTQVRERLINPQSSQTVLNEPINGKVAPFKAFKHIRNDGFGLQARSEYQ